MQNSSGVLCGQGDNADKPFSMYMNLLNCVTPLMRDGVFGIDWDDDIIAASCLTHGGAIKHPSIRQQLEGDTP